MSYSNLNGTSRTLVAQIYNSLKQDSHLRSLFSSQNQITLQHPSDISTKPPKPHVSVYLYNVTELASMRNQPQNTQQTLMYLNLHYLITPLTQSAEDDQLVLGKIMQLFAATPVLYGEALQGRLAEGNNELRVVFEEQSVDELRRLWSVLGMPFRLSVAYRVFPVRIDSPVAASPNKPVPLAAKSVIEQVASSPTLSLKVPVKRK